MSVSICMCFVYTHRSSFLLYPEPVNDGGNNKKQQKNDSRNKFTSDTDAVATSEQHTNSHVDFVVFAIRGTTRSRTTHTVCTARLLERGADTIAPRSVGLERVCWP